MDSMSWLSSLQASLGGYLPSILGALAILLLGWVVALIASAVTRKGLGKLGVNQRFGAKSEKPIDFERIASRVVFWFILLLAIVGMFGVLRVEGLSGPMSNLVDEVMGYLPRLLLAAALGLVAWVLATVVRTVINKVLGASKVDEKLSEGADMRQLSDVMGNVAYWLVFLLFLPAIVGALQIEGLMAPLSSMTTDLLGMLPNLLAAAIIGLIGWIIAKALRGLVSNLLAATGVDKFSQGSEATKDLKLSQLGGTLVFILVIVPALIAALDALKIEAISGPLTGMLDMFLAAVPHIIAAAAIVIVAWFVGRFVADLVTRLLANLGFDRLPERLGLGHALAPADGGTNAKSQSTLSQLGGRVALFFIMLFATVEAAHRIGFSGVRDLLETFIAFGADVLLGLVIFTVGYWLANLAATAIQRASPDGSAGLSRIARIAILGLVLAMGLRAMGIADEIVNLAFGLVLGAAAVAIALAFGLGGRDAAGKIANDWADKHLRK